MRLGKRTVRCIAITKICRVHFLSWCHWLDRVWFGMILKVWFG